MPYAVKHPKYLVGLVLVALLMVFSASPFSAPTPSLGSAMQFSTALQDDATDAPSSHDQEHQAPQKTLGSAIGAPRQNGSWLPEPFSNAEPEYELVFELAAAVTALDYFHHPSTYSHWHDWTRGPPATKHRLSGWKDSNLQYRFISQAQPA